MAIVRRLISLKFETGTCEPGCGDRGNWTAVTMAGPEIYRYASVFQTFLCCFTAQVGGAGTPGVRAFALPCGGKTAPRDRSTKANGAIDAEEFTGRGGASWVLIEINRRSGGEQHCGTSTI